MSKKFENDNKDDTLSKIVITNTTCLDSAYEWKKNKTTNTYTLICFDSEQIWLLLLLL